MGIMEHVVESAQCRQLFFCIRRYDERIVVVVIVLFAKILEDSSPFPGCFRKLLVSTAVVLLMEHLPASWIAQLVSGMTFVRHNLFL